MGLPESYGCYQSPVRESVGYVLCEEYVLTVSSDDRTETLEDLGTRGKEPRLYDRLEIHRYIQERFPLM